MDENGIRGFLSSLCLRVPFLGLDPEERNRFYIKEYISASCQGYSTKLF